MRNLAILAAGLIIVLFILFLHGCSSKQEIDDAIMQRFPNSKIVLYKESPRSHIGFYLICMRKTLYIIETSHSFWQTRIRDIQEVNPLEVQCVKE